MLGLAVILALAPGGNMRAMVIALAGVWAFGWHLLLQLRQLDTEDPLSCLRLFRSNRNTGLILTLFFAGALFV